MKASSILKLDIEEEGEVSEFLFSVLLIDDALKLFSARQKEIKWDNPVINVILLFNFLRRFGYGSLLERVDGRRRQLLALVGHGQLVAQLCHLLLQGQAIQAELGQHVLPGVPLDSIS